jgi:hypothetical protein
MILSERQSETLRNIRDLEMSGQRRFIYATEAQDLTKLGLVEKQAGVGPSYRCKRLAGPRSSGKAVVHAGDVIERKPAPVLC